MTRARDITSFTEFRTHLRDHLDQSKATGRPLFVTTNGETEAVVLSPTVFDELVEQAEARARSLKTLDRSMADMKARAAPALQKKALRQIADELKLKLDR